eukprot:2290196-Karenia_brevis.AAC.1
MADISEAQFHHEVREGLRLASWKHAESRREDMRGISGGIDRLATLALYKKRATTDYDKGVLRSILSGALRTQKDLHKAGIACSSHCPHCGLDVDEDLNHVWWDCPCWDAIRKSWANHLFLYRDAWPP